MNVAEARQCKATGKFPFECLSFNTLRYIVHRELRGESHRATPRHSKQDIIDLVRSRNIPVVVLNSYLDEQRHAWKFPHHEDIDPSLRTLARAELVTWLDDMRSRCFGIVRCFDRGHAEDASHVIVDRLASFLLLDEADGRVTHNLDWDHGIVEHDVVVSLAEIARYDYRTQYTTPRRQ